VVTFFFFQKVIPIPILNCQPMEFGFLASVASGLLRSGLKYL